jgi:hypothetical protein
MESFNTRTLFRCAFLPCNAYFKNAFQTNGDSYRKLNCNRQCPKQAFLLQFIYNSIDAFDVLLLLLLILSTTDDTL